MTNLSTGKFEHLLLQQSCLLAPEEQPESKAACTQTDSKGNAVEAANR